MSKLLRAGYRFSRDCFLCYGGALLLIAIVPLAVSLRDIRNGDWPPDEVGQLYSTTSYSALYGLIFLAAALALFKSKLWAPYVAVAVSGSALALIGMAWLAETSDREGFAIVLAFPAIPLLLVLCWSGAVLVRQSRERRIVERRNQIA